MKFDEHEEVHHGHQSHDVHEGKFLLKAMFS